MKMSKNEAMIRQDRVMRKKLFGQKILDEIFETK